MIDNSNMHIRVVQAVLRELGVSTDIKTVDSRRAIYSAVDSAQKAGVHLGYEFLYTKTGPVSNALLGDLYEISSSTLDPVSLKASVIEKLKTIPACAEHKPTEGG